MKYRSGRRLCAAAAAAVLAACGGGGDDLPPGAAGNAAPPVMHLLRGSAAAAPAGAKVFLDLNNDQAHDPDEPATLRADDGSFALPVPRLRTAQLAGAMLVAEASSPLLAPAARYMSVQGPHAPAILDAWSTRVALQIVTNGLTLDEALQAAQEPADRMPQAAPRHPAPAPTGYTRMIVRLDDSVADPRAAARAFAAAFGGEVRQAYRRAMKGFAVDVPDASLEAFVNAAQQDARVDFVEADQLVSGTQTQYGATWGLDRTDQRLLPLSNSYSFGATGAGVTAYILDSGLRETHAEFAGRVGAGHTTILDGRGTSDCHGHGTHVAGTVGGTTWGMAKGVTVVPVRVLGCDNRGSISGIIAGIDWMVANAARPAVANMSIGANASAALDAAVERAVAAGITVAISAGNDGANACNYSPARTPGALTVGATTNRDARPRWSNYGTCLDIFGPGQDITSAGLASDSASSTMWGTSMAAPHVAGLAAMLLQADPAMTPAQVAAAIRSAGTTGVLGSVGSGSPNLLLHAGALQEPAAVPAPAPASLSMSVGALTGSALAVSKGWQARVTIAIVDDRDAMVPGVVVRGGFTRGGSGFACTTAANGTCVITSGKLGTSTRSTVFTVAGASLAGKTYLPASNIATTVTILRP